MLISIPQYLVVLGILNRLRFDLFVKSYSVLCCLTLHVVPCMLTGLLH